ncbi:MAG: 16S rRNA (cytosine(1402)-N(4))-methyltransferase RsmH [Jatrophihabitans sp.]
MRPARPHRSTDAEEGSVTEQQRHVPVLRERVLALLAPALDGPDAVVVDATVGLGGHAEALLAAHPGVTLVGLDRDPEALQLSGDRLARFADRLHLVHAVYDEMPDVLRRLGLPGVDGVLFDLGVSSLQLDDTRRGFAYSHDAPLDMRMDQDRGITAADVVNGYSVTELASVLRTYGEERFALRIAKAIERARAAAPLQSTSELSELVRSAIPAAARTTGGHPAKRTFQALRIEVNAELDAVRDAIPAAVESLNLNGRIAVLAYHSLEDRIVKRTLATGASDRTPADLPVLLPDRQPYLRLLTHGAEKAGVEEIDRNPRAKSVRLRAAERIGQS